CTRDLTVFGMVIPFRPEDYW
nr:immunoglobulin heavy chain junction region [Macaca mulatta]